MTCPNSLGVSFDATSSYAPLMQQINRRYHGLGHAFNGCPSYRRLVENESERIAHGENISCQRTRCILERGSKLGLWR